MKRKIQIKYWHVLPKNGATAMLYKVHSTHLRAPFSPFAVIVALAFLYAGCDDSPSEGDGVVTVVHTFDENAEGWTGAFADYSTDHTEDDLGLRFQRRPLPADVNMPEQMGLFLSGQNLSDDLFMFVKRQATGLRPGTNYEVVYDLALASNSPSGCAGIGGAPGESVYLKVGASAIEPEPVVEGNDYRLNVDKGNQSQGGNNAVVVGHVGNTLQQCTETPFRMITRHNRNEPVLVTSTSDGDLWLFVGTDSGFEGTTELFYHTIQVTLTPR